MRRASLTAAALLAGTTGSAAFGQTIGGLGITGPGINGAAAPGQLLSATISQSVTADSNYRLDDPSPGTSYYADTRLSLGYSNGTPTSTFELGLDTGLRALWEAQKSFEFTLASPTSANLGYISEWANGVFDAALRYRQRSVDTSEFILTDPTDPGSLQQLQGNTREMRYDANIGVVFGTSTPSSYGLRFLANAYNYSDDNTNQVARSTVEGQGTWTLRLTPVLSSVVLADALHYSADDTRSTALDAQELTAGVAYQPSENFSLVAGLGYGSRKKSQDDPQGGGRQTTQNNSGPSLRGLFTYTTSNLTFAGNARLTAAAPETQLSGALSATYALPRGRLNGRVFQNYTSTDTGGQEAQIIGLAVGLAHDINAVSSVGINVGWAYQSDVYTNDPGPDIHRANVTATYSHALTEAVDAAIGYRFRNLEESPDNASSNAVFFQIGRTFETRP